MDIFIMIRDIGSINSDRYGNCLIIKTRDQWRRYEWDEWQKINGDWVYYLPLKEGENR